LLARYPAISFGGRIAPMVPILRAAHKRRVALQQVSDAGSVCLG
jgi:hypothetical protein